MKISYKAKNLLVLLTTTGVIFTVVLTFYFLRFQKVVYQDATKMVDAYVRENANEISAEFNTDMGVCRALAQVFAASQTYHNENKWQEYTDQLKMVDQESVGYLNVWSSFELAYFRKNYDNTYGRRVLNVYTLEGKQQINDYFKNLEGDDIGSSYHMAKMSKKELVIEPYLFSLSGEKKDEQLVTSICVPILKDNNYMGLAGVDIGLERYKTLTDEIKPFDDSYSFLVAYDGRIVTHPNKELINQTYQKVFPEIENKQSVLKKIQAGETFSFLQDQKNNEYFSFAPIVIGNSNTPWSLVTVTPEKDIYAEAKAIINQTLFIGFLGFLLLAVVIWFLISQLISNINKFIVFARRVNDGELTQELDIDRNDELGELAAALRQMTSSLRKIVNQLKMSSHNIIEASKHMNENSQTLSYTASKQAAEVEEISSALEQMVSFIDDNAENSQRTAELARQSKEHIVESSKSSDKAAQNIKEIVTKNQLITDIAFQTNILALNAAVEAARAGDAGRGFSVVAAEVRKLAERSKEAAEQISHLSEIVVSDSISVNKQLGEAVPEIEETSNLVQSISGASKEQSEGVNQINISIRELNDITQNNAASAESLAASAEELSAQSEQLEKLVETFKSE